MFPRGFWPAAGTDEGAGRMADGFETEASGRIADRPNEGTLGTANKLPKPPTTPETILPIGSVPAVAPGTAGPAADGVITGTMGVIDGTPIPGTDGTASILPRPPAMPDRSPPSGFCGLLDPGRGGKITEDSGGTTANDTEDKAGEINGDTATEGNAIDGNAIDGIVTEGTNMPGRLTERPNDGEGTARTLPRPPANPDKRPPSGFCTPPVAGADDAPAEGEFRAGTERLGNESVGIATVGIETLGFWTPAIEVMGIEIAGTATLRAGMTGSERAGIDIPGSETLGTERLGVGSEGERTGSPGAEKADAGTETPGMERAGAEIAGSERTGSEGAGIEIAGIERDTPGSDRLGTTIDTAGIERAGNDMPGSATLGAEITGSEGAGIDSPGSERSGSEGAGIDTPGTDTDTAGVERVGTATDTAGAERAGSETLGSTRLGIEITGSDMTGTPTEMPEDSEGAGMIPPPPAAKLDTVTPPAVRNDATPPRGFGMLLAAASEGTKAPFTEGVDTANMPLKAPATPESGLPTGVRGF
ncbi:hypothetical protein PSPO01_04363 [Paraphaeosphaeria sporulosa]